MRSPPRTTVLRGLDALHELGAELDDLLRASGAPVTARRTWLAAWLRASTAEPCVVVARDDAGLAGAVPLAMTRRRGVSHIVMMGHGTSDRTVLAVRDADAVPALAEAVLEAADAWPTPWALRIEQLPFDDRVATSLAEGFRCAELVEGEPCPVLRFDADRDPASYETSKFKKQVRAGRNRLQTDDRSFEVVRLQTMSAIEDGIEEIARVHRERDHVLGRRSDHDDVAGLQRWSDLVLDHARRDELEVLEIVIDGSLAAYGIAFLDTDAYRVWDARIDAAFARYAPGHLLGEALLHASLTHDQVRIFDWGRGTEPYKQLIAPELEPRRDLSAWSSRRARAALEAPRRARRALARFADRHPRLRQAWVALKRRTVAR